MATPNVPQSVTARVALKAYLSSDHLSNATSKTIAITISKNGAAFGNPSGGATNATEIANGWYYVDLSTTDTGTAGPLIVYGTASGTDNVEVGMMVVDAHNGGFDGIPSAVAGASAGLLINGSNSGTVTLAALTITGATTHTGNVALAAGLTITQSTTNGAGVSITGNGTGQGVISTGGATGPGAKFVGGGTSGDGIDITTTAGDGFSITPTAGSALVLTANGTSKHGLVATGGTAGTSDGIKAVAGTGGVPIRGDFTSNITGNLSGSVGSVTGAVGSVTADVGITQAAADKVLGTSAAVLPELTTVPAATPTPAKLLMLIYQTLRNKLTTTATAKTIYNDAGVALGAKTLADSGTTYTESKLT